MTSRGRITDSFPQRKTRATSKADEKKKPSKVKGERLEPSASDKQFENDQQVLKEFDLNWEYGPCMGVTRMERWKRADKHGLNPPEAVKDLVELHSNEKTYTECLWHDYNIL